MIMDLQIYIPSYKRPNAPLIKKIKEAGLPFNIVIDHKDDVEAYKPLQDENAKLLLIEPPQGIGYVRQRIKDLYNGKPIIMLDDDTVLSLRDKNEPCKLRNVKTAEDVHEWFNTIDAFCKSYKFDIGTAADAPFSYNDMRLVLHGTPCCSVTIFNSERCKEIDYDPLLYKRMEDWDLIMQGITKHFEFLVCNSVLRHCPMNKSAKDVGGCSEVYRDRNVMFRTTSYLTQKWGGDIVSLRRSKQIGDCFDFKVDLRKLRKRYGYNY